MHAGRPLYAVEFMPTAAGTMRMPTASKPFSQIWPLRKVFIGGIGYGAPAGRQISSALASPDTPTSRATLSYQGATSGYEIGQSCARLCSLLILKSFGSRRGKLAK